MLTFITNPNANPDVKTFIHHTNTISHIMCFRSSEFDKELEKTWQQQRLTQDVFISNENQTHSLPQVPVTFSGTMHTIYHFVNKPLMAASPPCDGCVPWLLAITPLLLRLPSICVMSKRPYQCCWCRSRKCTPLLPISQNMGSSIRKHVPTYTSSYWNNSAILS